MTPLETYNYIVAEHAKGRKSHEIALDLGCSGGTVRKRLSRGAPKRSDFWTEERDEQLRGLAGKLGNLRIARILGCDSHNVRRRMAALKLKGRQQGGAGLRGYTYKPAKVETSDDRYVAAVVAQGGFHIATPDGWYRPMRVAA